MLIERFDPAGLDDVDLAALHQVVVASLAADQPDYPPPAAEDLLADLRAQRFDSRLAPWRAIVDGQPVGLAQLFLPDRENTGLGLLDDLDVHPAHRRHGIGTALLRASVVTLAAEGRRTVLIETIEGSPGYAFCDALGFDVALRDQASLLKLDAVDWLDVERLAAAERAGYRLVRWVGSAPDELLDSYAQAKSAMSDAPIGTMQWEHQRWVGGAIREYEETTVQRGREYRVVVAVHELTGEVAGLTEVAISRWTPHRSFQDDTAVVPAHRGHGLGIWMKAAMLQWLRAERPDVAELITWNAVDNVHMRRINTRLGFRPYRLWTERQAAVADLAARLAEMPERSRSATNG
jgi:GNAT superfamily N-acetyltransferase